MALSSGWEHVFSGLFGSTVDKRTRNNWYACKGKSGPVFCSLAVLANWHSTFMAKRLHTLANWSLASWLVGETTGYPSVLSRHFEQSFYRRLLSSWDTLQWRCRNCWRTLTRQLPILYNSEKKAKSVGCKIEDMRSRLCFSHPDIPGCLWIHVETDVDRSRSARNQGRDKRGEIWMSLITCGSIRERHEWFSNDSRGRHCVQFCLFANRGAAKISIKSYFMR